MIFNLGFQSWQKCVAKVRKIDRLNFREVSSNPNQTESYPAIAIELQGDYYVPIYDLQGNISCLIDPQQRNALESYRYTAFGEETIFNQKGKVIASSMAQNPWRYKGKRVDPEKEVKSGA